MNPRIFLTVEGIEGVGKTTVMQFIDAYLTQHQVAHTLTREPGGTEIAEKIRQFVLLDQHQEFMCHDTELLLMFAARAQHIASVIKPGLANDHWIVCDRFTDASFAYQGGARGIPLDRIRQLESWVQGDLKPDCTLLLDAPVDIALARIQKRGELDRIESETHQFFERARQAYLDRVNADPSRYKIIDATQTIEQVQDQVATVIQSLLMRE